MRRMGRKGLMGWRSLLMGMMGMMGMIGIMGGMMMSCSSDSEEEVQEWKWELPIALKMAARPFVTPEEAVKSAVTRAWVPDDPYELYDDLYGSGVYYHTLTDKTINAFFATETDASLHGRLRRKSDGTWMFNINSDPDLVAPGKYYLYGFIPNESADGATLEPLNPSDTYDNGAVLTIHGLKSVATDACVIIGAKDSDNPNNVTNLRAGDFSFNLNTGPSATNYLYLLFDHLCSALAVSMKVDDEYNQLRTIKLKELILQTATAEGLTKDKMDVEITLNTTDGTSPISDIRFTPTGTATNTGSVFQSEEGLTLTTDYSEFMSHFIPQGTTMLILRSTYDVYDKNATVAHPEGNLIRKDCTAENTISLNKIIARVEDVRRGQKYNLNITVKPTYLYDNKEAFLIGPIGSNSTILISVELIKAFRSS